MTAPDTSSPSPRRSAPFALRAVKAIASLQLTVVLFALSIGLVFFGTVAQKEYGVWTVVDKYFWSWFVWVPFDLFQKFGQVFAAEYFPKDAPSWQGAFPFPAGKLLGGLMLLNLLAAHLVRFKISWRRAGVLLIHAGLILLFVGEFITREYAVEQRMIIRKGQTVDFTENSRNVELAFVERSHPADDNVTVVPQSLLRKGGGRITDAALPADVEVVKYMANSTVMNQRPTEPIATAGYGLLHDVKERPEVSGADQTQKVDTPAAFIKLYKKGTNEAIGTYLVAVELHWEQMVDTVEIDGKKYELSLRFERYYKPFRVHLDDVHSDFYPGSEKPRNYSSDVKVFDASGNLTRELTIRMNEPLRYEGETFYQSGISNVGTEERTTILQVVKNPGWLIPYISCVMVGLGLIVHFGLMLGKFLTKKNVVQELLADAPSAAIGSNWWQRNLPWVAFAVVCIYLLSVYGRMKPKAEFDLNAAAHIPVLEGGRVKPLDSVARMYLRSISGKSDFEDANGNEQPAIRWYLDTLAADPKRANDPAWEHKVIRIDNEQVLGDLGLKVREGLRYSLNELKDKISKIGEKAQQSLKKLKEKKPLDTTETKFIELAQRLELFMFVARGHGQNTEKNILHLVPPREGSDKWMSLGALREAAEDAKHSEATYVATINTIREKLRNRPGGFGPDDEQKVLKKLLGEELPNTDPKFVEKLRQMLFVSPPAQHDSKLWVEIERILSVELPEADRAALQVEKDKAYKAALAETPAVADWEAMLAAYRAGNAVEFNRLLGEYLTNRTQTVSGPGAKTTKLEVTYNRFAPFLRCAGLYVLALVLCVVGFVFRAAEQPLWGDALRRSALAVLGGTLLVHTISLLTRMYLLDRPLVFVTNLYSSAVFIGWGCVIIGIVLEKLYPIGVGNVVAAVLGVSTSIIAHNLATSDTLEMMEAVLDTNFWLATHVTTVTLGYTATLVAGFLGAVYVFQMLAAVIRDSYENPEPTIGSLMTFGLAVAGLVAIPMLIAWPIVNALRKFELLPSMLVDILQFLVLGVGFLYAFSLLMLRASLDGTMRNTASVGTTPTIAKPITRMALTPEVSKILGQMIYGVVCFAMMLSFIGTVLGGIWADQSWGRFWGWDPKENGAVLIVLWNALILHARWCGLVKTRGIAVLAVAGNIITAWSWFGTNQLGIGLHAYGFDTRLADACTNFWLGMLVIVGLGTIPQRYWQRTPPPAVSAAEKAKETVHPLGTPSLAKETTNGHHANGKAGKGKKAKKK